MMKLKLILLVAISLIVQNRITAQITTVTFSNTTKDAKVSSGSQSQTNFGSQSKNDVFYMYSSQRVEISRTFLHFDLSSIPSDVIIVSAQLDLYPSTIINGGDHSIYIERVDSNGIWQENSITWLNQPSVISNDQLAFSHQQTQNTSLHQFDVAGHVNLMIKYPNENNGWGIRLQNESGSSSFGIIYHSSEANNQSKRPTLTIQFKPALSTTFNADTKKGTLTVAAPSGSTGPYKYLISYEPLLDLASIWNEVKNDLPVSQTVFYSGDVQNSEFTFSDLEAERYYVGIYDNGGNKISDLDGVVGPDITLVNASNIQYSNGSIHFSGNIQSGNGTASIEGQLEDTQEEGIEFELETLDDLVLGFNKISDQQAVSTQDFDLGVELFAANSAIKVFTEGTLQFEDVIQVGDRLRLEKRDGKLLCYFKGFEVAAYTIPTTGEGIYRTDLLFKGIIGKLKKVTKYGDYVEFFLPYRVEAIHARDCDNPNGGVSIIPAFGITGTGTYTITNLETGAIVSGTIADGELPFSIPLPVGEYSISFTWAGGFPAAYTRYFSIGLPIEWGLSNAYFLEVPMTVNTITTDGSANTGKAFSQNTLLGTEEGWVLFHAELKKYYPPWGGPYLYDGALNVKAGLGSSPTTIYAKVNVHSIGPDIINKYVWVTDESNTTVSTPFTTWRDGPFKIKLEAGNFKVTYNNGITPIATIPAPVAIPSYKLYGSALSATIYDSYASFCRSIPEQYVTPKREIEGGYFLVPEDDILRFEFNEEYTLGDQLNYTVKDFQGATVLDPDAIAITEAFGDNRLQLNVSSLTTNQFYIMEVMNDKGENWFIRFKKQ